MVTFIKRKMGNSIFLYAKEWLHLKATTYIKKNIVIHSMTLIL